MAVAKFCEFGSFYMSLTASFSQHENENLAELMYLDIRTFYRYSLCLHPLLTEFHQRKVPLRRMLALDARTKCIHAASSRSRREGGGVWRVCASLLAKQTRYLSLAEQSSKSCPPLSTPAIHSAAATTYRMRNPLWEHPDMTSGQMKFNNFYLIGHVRSYA